MLRSLLSFSQPLAARTAGTCIEDLLFGSGYTSAFSPLILKEGRKDADLRQGTTWVTDQIPLPLLVGERSYGDIRPEVILYMLLGFSESAFLHQKAMQVIRQYSRVVSKASTSTTFVHVLRLRKRYKLWQESIEMSHTVNIMCRHIP